MLRLFYYFEYKDLQRNVILSAAKDLQQNVILSESEGSSVKCHPERKRRIFNLEDRCPYCILTIPYQVPATI